MCGSFAPRSSSLLLLLITLLLVVVSRPQYSLDASALSDHLAVGDAPPQHGAGRRLLSTQNQPIKSLDLREGAEEPY
ncbi:hypothetical protein OsI_00566 [Oryza sativa Indica Group]|uniref:Uncharacterized protein n=1 Tax=Oryza sativa subsp. indica TaxID=39946 RepID=A2WL53_ORYSI|nr:hypothetical protein OsI_00566 [Oryza sativa Indica Group]